MPTIRILLADDQEAVRRLIGITLGEDEFELVYATDGEEALRVIRETKPDLVLLDLILPGKYDGFEVLQKMREDPTLDSRSVVIISNLGQESDMERVKQLGAVEYFVKAKTSIDDLVNRIKTLLNTPSS